MRIFNRLTAIISLFLVMTVGVPAVAAAAASPFDASKTAACQGVNFSDTGSCSAADSKRLSKVIKLVISILSLIVGVAAVIMIIVGGLKYVTSQGDPSQVSSAKKTLLYAIIGLIIVALAQIIVHFVLKEAKK